VSRSNKNITETLLAMGAIDPPQAQAAETYARQWGRPFHEAVVERRFCSADDVVRAFSMMTGYPVVNLDAEALDDSLMSLLPLKAAEQWRAVALRVSGKRGEVIDVAIAPPVEMSVVDGVLALSRKVRANVHVASNDAVDRAIARLYKKGGAVEPVAAPPPPAPERHVDVQDEVTFDFGDEAPPPAVKLFGWHPAAMRAVVMMLERGGITAQGIDDTELERLGPDEVVISTTLGLRAVLPPDAKLRLKLIICGTNEQGDPEDARALGAKLFLRPPLSTEQLVASIKKVRR
jgi:hypothetical protein